MSGAANSVLVVDDDAAIRAGLEIHFRRQGWRVETAAGVAEAAAKFRRAPRPLVVTDMRMPDGDGLDVTTAVRERAPETAVILMTAFGGVPEAVRAMRAGARDYLIKPVAFPQLLEAAEQALAGGGEPALDRQETSRVGRADPPAPARDEMIGDSAVMLQLRERARRVAQTSADVLIEAESGAGKELLARALHAASPRRRGPLVAVNCAALPEALLESELFGHARGAFSGALAEKPGKFELAHGGTLLLDEIGEMPLELQPKLLRALQEREVDRLGGTRAVAVDVRVVATTNRSLRAMVAAGAFRADLYYRLNVVPLRIPPLRERREDIGELARHFLAKHGGAGLEFAPELLAALAARDWPGNVRELENFARRAAALAPGPVIGLEALREQEAEGEALPAAPVGAGEKPLAPAGVSMKEAERRLLAATLAAVGGNRTRAASMLGVSLRTIRNKIREYQLPPRSRS